MSWESLIDYYEGHPFENELEKEVVEKKKKIDKQEKQKDDCVNSDMPDDK